jgi:hypothetical protein
MLLGRLFCFIGQIKGKLKPRVKVQWKDQRIEVRPKLLTEWNCPCREP